MPHLMLVRVMERSLQALLHERDQFVAPVIRLNEFGSFSYSSSRRS